MYTLDELKIYQKENFDELTNGFSDIRKINGLIHRLEAAIKLAENAVFKSSPGSLPSQTLKEFHALESFISEHHCDALYSMRYIEKLGENFQLALRLAEEFSQVQI